MKNLIIALSVFCAFNLSYAQEKFITKTGELNFEASVPSFEEVKANNKNASAILTEDGTLVCLALVKGFRFKVALMEEHFNENYAESSDFPKTTFKGKIADFNVANLSKEEKTFTVSGVITLHGVEKQVEVPVSIKKEGSNVHLTTNFTLKPADFDIEIPSVVSSKIAETINVSANFVLKSKS